MKRTGEIVLTVIGMVINGLMAVLLSLVIPKLTSDSFQQTVEDQLANNPEANGANAGQVLDMLAGLGWAVVIATGIGFVLGLIAVIALKGNKKPKLAGILLILGALIGGIVSLGSGFLPAILYLIAGIMALVRKPKTFAS